MLAVYAFGVQTANVYAYSLWINMLGGMLSIPLLLFFYRRDQRSRGKVFGNAYGRRSPGDLLLVFLLGAALAQYLNLLLNVLQLFQTFPEYSDSMERLMENQSVFLMLFWTVIVAPVAEEILFRWVIYRRLRDWMGIFGAVVISSLLFGIYHGNVLQFIYATVMGMALALSIEYTENLYASIFLHIGANLWSTVVSEYGEQLLRLGNGIVYEGILLALLVILILGGRSLILRRKK